MSDPPCQSQSGVTRLIKFNETQILVLNGALKDFSALRLYFPHSLYAVLQVPVVRKVDNSIHGINLYPVDNAIDFPIPIPLDSDLSGG